MAVVVGRVRAGRARHLQVPAADEPDRALRGDGSVSERCRRTATVAEDLLVVEALEAPAHHRGRRRRSPRAARGAERERDRVRLSRAGLSGAQSSAARSSSALDSISSEQSRSLQSRGSAASSASQAAATDRAASATAGSAAGVCGHADLLEEAPDAALVEVAEQPAVPPRGRPRRRRDGPSRASSPADAADAHRPEHRAPPRAARACLGAQAQARPRSSPRAAGARSLPTDRPASRRSA